MTGIGLGGGSGYSFWRLIASTNLEAHEKRSPTVMLQEWINHLQQGRPIIQTWSQLRTQSQFPSAYAFCKEWFNRGLIDMWMSHIQKCNTPIDLKPWTVFPEHQNIWFLKEKKGSKMGSMPVMIPHRSIREEGPDVVWHKEAIPILSSKLILYSNAWVCSLSVNPAVAKQSKPLRGVIWVICGEFCVGSLCLSWPLPLFVFKWGE